MWPKPEYIYCNFPRDLLEPIISAIKVGSVKWGRSCGFGEAFTSTFYFAECEWEINEVNEIITSISLVNGVIDTEVLTVAILTGKIDNSYKNG